MWSTQNFFKTISLVVLVFIMSGLSAQETLDDAKALYNEGGTAMTEGNLELAIEKFNACIDICNTLYEEEEDTEAEELMYTVQGNVPKLYYQLSTEKLQAGEIDAGIEYAKQAKETGEWYGESDVVEKVNKLLPQVYYKMGVGHYKNKKFDEALSSMDQAIEVDPNYANAHYIKVVIYKTQDNDELLLDAAKKGVAAAEADRDQKTKEKIVKLASAHFLKKGSEAKQSSKYDEAIVDVERTIEVDPENTDAYFLLASIYNAQENYNKAIEAATEGLKYEDATNAARFNYELGNAYFGNGDNAAACEAYSKAAVGDYAANANYQMEHVVKCGQ